MQYRILAIDDDAVGGRLLRAILSPEGFELTLAQSGEDGLALLEASEPHLVILDLRLPGLDGLEVLGRLRKTHPNLPVIMVTAFGDVRTAIEATRFGAFDYLSKPIDHEQLLFTVNRALETRILRDQVRDLQHGVAVGGTLSWQMGNGPAVTRIVEQVRSVAATSFSVLILGETGTGKELVAQAIHRQSERLERPFVAVDCGAIPEALIESELFGHEKGAFTGAGQRRQGQFRLAEGGTLFLDEVGNLPMGLQAKLLRVLESKQLQSVGGSTPQPLDVRFLAATNSDLQLKASQGSFRADLYFRLAQYSISLPPLRERAGDIPYLAKRCLEEVSVELRRPMLNITRDALALLQRYAWPGNVRELRNVVRQAVLESTELVLSADHFKRLVRGGDAVQPSLGEAASEPSLREIANNAAREAERRAIADALRRNQGNKSRAAKMLRTDYKTLYLKMKSLGLRSRDFTPAQ
ncbi:MAG: sigma-54 dependent transcriptional regulator [Myxococcales bacterium]